MPPRKCDPEDTRREYKEKAATTIWFQIAYAAPLYTRHQGLFRVFMVRGPQPRPHCLPSQPTSSSLVCSKGGAIKGVGVGGSLSLCSPHVFPSSLQLPACVKFHQHPFLASLFYCPLFLNFIYFLATLSGRQNLSWPSRGQTCMPTLDVWSLSHWTTREGPQHCFQFPALTRHS